MYKIFVNGVYTEPETVKVSAQPFNRTWPGKQRDESQTETAYMLRIFGYGELNISVETDFCISEAVVRPLSKKAKITQNEKRVDFVIKENGKYSLELNGHHHAIHLIYQKELPLPQEKPTYCFDSGHYYIGFVQLKDGDSVYISKDAVVHGSFYGCSVENITIYGNGILCGDWETRTEKHGDIGFDNENAFNPSLVHTYGGIRMYHCKNISVQGITVTDTASYAISFFATDNIYINDVNVLGIWKYNTDGIDFFNSSNIEVKNCFIRSFDDCMCMKGLTAFSDMNTENAYIENCVFWCDWGKNIDIGLATACKEIQNIVWKNCDIIHNNGTCIAISNGQWADVHDVLVENLNIEYSAHTQAPVFQQDDCEKYPSDFRLGVPKLIFITDSRRNWQGNISYEDSRTKIRNVKIRDINVIMDKSIDCKPDIRIEKATDKSFFENIDISNVFINGVKQDVGKSVL